MPSNAQIVIQLDSAGNLTAETTAPNGQRRKIDLSLDPEGFKADILAALTERRDELNRAELAKLRHIQTANIDHVLSNHGTAFARQIWHNGENVSNLNWKRHLAGDFKIKTTGDGPFSTNKVKPGKVKGKKKQPKQPRLNIDINL